MTRYRSTLKLCEAKQSAMDQTKSTLIPGVAPHIHYLSSISIKPMITRFAQKIHEILQTSRQFMPWKGLSRPYPGVLPTDLAPWHYYAPDIGHSIMCLAARQVKEPALGSTWLFEKSFEASDYDVDAILAGDTKSIRDWLIPIPVKAVMRDYRIERGYVVANVDYDPSIGVETDPKDDEF